MAEENQAPEQNKTWNQQFAEWHKASGRKISDLARELGIPRSTLSDYMNSKTTDLARVSPKNLTLLYSTTQLECFKYSDSQTPKIPVPGAEESPKDYSAPEKRGRGRPKGSRNKPKETQLESVSDLLRVGREGIDRIVESVAVQLSSYETVNYGMLKAQQYRPTAAQRAEAIMQTLDILAEEVDYFRTAPESEKKVLVEKLQDDPQSFSYASQMLNIIYSGKKLDSWMLMAQPPSKIKRLTRGEK